MTMTRNSKNSRERKTHFREKHTGRSQRTHWSFMTGQANVTVGLKKHAAKNTTTAFNEMIKAHTSPY